ncbi:hypothetical protein [Streptomyces sp. NPDC005955]|uniref:hypothetical protein n=1 Tax=Streptomyces sp. NPDC005955 TaxID=3364738 RepID=UPI00368FA96E
MAKQSRLVVHSPSRGRRTGSHRHHDDRFEYGNSRYGPTITAKVNGAVAAQGTWIVDPIDGHPGDTIDVTDLRTDGQHITGCLTGRTT